MTLHTGSCLCGQVKFKTKGELRPVRACHCLQCRKTSGHFVAATQIDTQNLEIDGTVTWYQSSTKARRGFCGICGSPLFWQPGNRAKTSIFAGSIDGATGLKLDSQIHIDSKGDYYDAPDVPVIEQTPIEP